MTTPDPIIQRILLEPDNLQFIKSAIGLTELVIPDEDSRNKQLREIQQLLAATPVARVFRPGDFSADGVGVFATNSPASPTPARLRRAGDPSEGAGYSNRETVVVPGVPIGSEQPSVGIDELLDDHAVEFEVCKRWASSDAGQTAKMENPLGFANVRAHAAAHLAALQRSDGGAKPPVRSAAPA